MQNFALYHCLGPSIQTALFNAPLVVIVGWGLGKPMDRNVEIFMGVLLVLSIFVVGKFLRDGSYNYLAGGLLLVRTFLETTWGPLLTRSIADCIRYHCRYGLVLSKCRIDD